MKWRSKAIYQVICLLLLLFSCSRGEPMPAGWPLPGMTLPAGARDVSYEKVERNHVVRFNYNGNIEHLGKHFVPQLERLGFSPVIEKKTRRILYYINEEEYLAIHFNDMLINKGVVPTGVVLLTEYQRLDDENLDGLLPGE